MKGFKIAAVLTALLLTACGKGGAKTTPSSDTTNETVSSTEIGAKEADKAADDMETGAIIGAMAVYDREYVADGFSFGPLNEAAQAKIVGVSFPKEGARIELDDLCHVAVLHYDFDSNVKQGELIVNKKLAKEVTEIFYELYQNQYPIESIKLVDEFNGDDEKSMAANNTSCFNYRNVDNSKSLSKHAYGAAIDINPRLNPYVTSRGVSPANGEEYSNRSKAFKGKIDKSDLAYKLFTKRGWTWGGNWRSVKDYQHFQKDV